MSTDAIHPHISRIYDYILGGTFNHEADRRAAEAMVARIPAYPRWARANRAFLGRVGALWASQGRARVLDLGSGLPTQGHLNTSLPQARILFADIDALTVSQGLEILAGAPDKAYVEADLRAPDALMAHAEAFFGAERVLAVGVIGVIYFLSDDQVRLLMDRLHAFCAPGSVLAVSFPSLGEGHVTDTVEEIIRELSSIARIAFFHRSPEQIAALLAPWRTTSVETIAPAPPAGDGAGSPMDRLEMFGAFAERA